LIGANEINKAFERLAGGNDDGTRYVIDMGTLTDQTYETCNALPPQLGNEEKPPNIARALWFCCKISPCKWVFFLLVVLVVALVLGLTGYI